MSSPWMMDTYAIIRVSEVMKGQSFNFKEVKDHIQT